VPLGPRADVGQEEPAGQDGVLAVVEHARHGPLEGSGKLALLELVDDVHLVLDRVPDVEIVVPRQVHVLAGEEVLLGLHEESPGRPVSLLIAGHGEVEDVAEQDQVVDVSDDASERGVGGAQGGLAVGPRGHERAEVVPEMDVGDDGHAHAGGSRRPVTKR
jgi:hypothetical protein